MRRLWAYITLAFSALVIMLTSFSNIFLNASTNLEYSQGREMVFYISEKDESNPVREQGDPTMASSIAKIMEDRLAGFDIDSFEITTLGDNAIKVNLYQEKESHYDYLAKYLSFNGSLAITTSANGPAVAWTKDPENPSTFINGGAYRVQIGDINPAIVIPVNQDDTNFKEVLAEAQKAYEDRGEPSEEGEEESVYLYFWHDYEEGDSYESLSKQSEVLSSKLVMPLTYAPDESDGTGNKNLYYNGNKGLMYAMINQDIDGDGNVTSLELKEAYWITDYYVKLINAVELPYKVEYTYYNTSAPIVEPLVTVTTSERLANSTTLIATLVAIAVLSLLLVVFFRLGSLAAIVTTIGSVFGGVGLLVATGATFNTAAVVGLVLVAIASLVSNVIYLTKLKDEAYRGRTLKKANAEAGKKSVLPIVDVNVVVIVIGAMMFLMGGSMMRPFAAVTVLGGLCSLLLNLIVLRILMWLATNTTKLSGRYGLFGIEADKVPDHTNEEKQTYFGAYAEKDFTKSKKPVGIITALLFIATLAGSITFSVLNNGDLFRTSNPTRDTQVILSIEDEGFADGNERLAKILNNIHYYSNPDSKEEDRLKSPTIIQSKVNPTTKEVEYIATYDSPSEALVTYRKNVDEDKYDEVKTFVYIVTLDSSFNEKMYACYSDGTTKIGTESDAFTINELFEEFLDDGSSPFKGYKANLSLKSATLVYSSTPKVGTTPKPKMLLIATLIASAILMLYFLLRYRLTRGLASIILPLANSMITIGIFALVRVIASSYIVVAVPLVCAFTFMLSIIYMNKEREMVIEDKTHDKSVENRQAIMKKAVSTSFTAMIYSAVLAIYLVINFFGFGPANTAMIYIVAIVGCILAIVLVPILNGPLAQLLYKWFSKIHVNRKPRKAKKNKPVNKSAEPEEAIFIGIND